MIVDSGARRGAVHNCVGLTPLLFSRMRAEEAEAMTQELRHWNHNGALNYRLSGIGEPSGKVGEVFW
jgi:hypothetical protein